MPYFRLRQCDKKHCSDQLINSVLEVCERGDFGSASIPNELNALSEGLSNLLLDVKKKAFAIFLTAML